MSEFDIRGPYLAFVTIRISTPATKPDLLATNNSNPSMISVLLEQQGRRTFGTKTDYTAFWPFPVT